MFVNDYKRLVGRKIAQILRVCCNIFPSFPVIGEKDKKMDTKRIFSALLSAGLLFTTAFAQNYQVMEKQYFPSAPITGLIVDGAFSVEFTTGDNPSITVIGDVDVTPKVKVEEIISKNDETVFIKVSSDDGKNTEKCKLIIESGEGENLEQINLSGVVSFETKNPIEADEFLINTGGATSATIDGVFRAVVVESTGASDVHISGTAHSIVVEASGVSKVDISKLEYRSAEINASGVSHVSVKSEADNKFTNSDISSIKVDSGSDDQNVSRTIVEGSVIVKTAEGSDSTVIQFLDNKMIISNADGNTETISIGPCDIRIKQNKAVKIWNKRKDKFDGHWGGIELGINGYNTPDFNMDFPQGYEYMDLNIPKSTAFYLNLLEYNVALAKNQKWGMLSGLGFEWHNYRFSNDVWLSMENGTLQSYYIGGAPVKKTKLMVCYMTVPVIFEFQTNNKSRLNSFHVGVGVVGGLRIGTHTKVKFENKNSSYYLATPLSLPTDPEGWLTSASKKMKNHNDFYLNPMKLDATVRVGWSCINLFATYSLTKMFRDNRGPELYPWTVGITLLGW